MKRGKPLLAGVVVLAVMANVVMAGTPTTQAAEGVAIIDDQFDDGDLATNTKGKGSGWVASEINKSLVDVSEADSKLTLTTQASEMASVTSGDTLTLGDTPYKVTWQWSDLKGDVDGSPFYRVRFGVIPATFPQKNYAENVRLLFNTGSAALENEISVSAASGKNPPAIVLTIDKNKYTLTQGSTVLSKGAHNLGASEVRIAISYQAPPEMGRQSVAVDHVHVTQQQSQQ